MKRICVLLLVSLCAAGVPSAALAAEAPAAPRPLPPSASPPLIPPALQALEQRMAQIRFNSLRFSTRLDLGLQDSNGSSGISISAADVRVTSSEINRYVVFSTSGVLGLSPLLLSSTSTAEGGGPGEAVGGTPMRELRIGASTYLYEPSAARHDGGRPWVRSTRSAREERLAARLAPVTAVLSPLLAGLERPAANPSGPFAPLLEMLGEALSIQEAGAATVDGQQTLAFTLTLSSARLLERALSTTELRRLGKGEQDTHFTLEVWLAPSGLPVRALTTDEAPGEEFSSQEDILGLEVPVLVHAPPADRTIGQARWLKLERRRAKAIARCIRHRPRRARTCVALRASRSRGLAN